MTWSLLLLLVVSGVLVGVESGGWVGGVVWLGVGRVGSGDVCSGRVYSGGLSSGCLAIAAIAVLAAMTSDFK